MVFSPWCQPSAIRLEPADLDVLEAGTEWCTGGHSMQGLDENAGESPLTKTNTFVAEPRAWQRTLSPQEVGQSGMQKRSAWLLCVTTLPPTSLAPEDPGASFCLCEGSRPSFRGSHMLYGKGTQNFSLILSVRILKSQVILNIIKLITENFHHKLKSLQRM